VRELAEVMVAGTWMAVVAHPVIVLLGDRSTLRYYCRLANLGPRASYIWHWWRGPLPRMLIVLPPSCRERLGLGPTDQVLETNSNILSLDLQVSRLNSKLNLISTHR
jgi:hypothetical protein